MFSENCKIESRPFQIIHYSCATPPSQWSTLNPDYILMYAQLLIVKVATFVVVLWIFRFDVCLDCILLHHLCHPLLANISSYIFSHSLPMSLLISLSRHCFLLPRKQSLVLPQFHLGPEIYLVLVEYWLTNFIYFVVFVTIVFVTFFFVIIFIVKLLLIIIQFWNPTRIEYYIVFLICSMLSRAANVCTCLIIIGVIGILVKIWHFTNLLVCKYNILWPP